ncbi:hypothetical protein WDU94_013681 [Cyamophila willieti]
MQADVKTAKDIPLALFMELKAQYEGEMGKSGEMMGVKSGGEECGGMRGGGFGGGAASGGNAGKSCEYNGGEGRQNCGLGCSKYGFFPLIYHFFMKYKIFTLLFHTITLRSNFPQEP